MIRLLLCAVVAITICPDCAFADAAIERAVKPYFVLGGSVAALVFLGIGVFLLFKAIRYRRLAAAAEQWPSAEGTVLAAEIVKRTSQSDDDSDSFVPRLRYAYVANGIRREGDVIRIGLEDLGYRQEKHARDHMARYPVGATVVVRYDPESPDLAVLEAGQLGAGRKLFAGMLLAAIGSGAIVFAIWIASLPAK